MINVEQRRGGCFGIIISSTIKQEMMEFCFTKDLDGGVTEGTVGAGRTLSNPQNFKLIF